MTLPTGNELIPFEKAQAAIAAVSDAFERAIREEVTDPDLRRKVLSAAVGYIFRAMLSHMQDEMNDAGELNTPEDKNAFEHQASELLDRIFEPDEGVE